MSEFTLIPNIKYHVRNQENIKSTKRKLSEPIIVEEEEESSDSGSERIEVLNTALNSLQQKISRLSSIFKRKRSRRTFAGQEMQQNEVTEENPGEQRSSPITEYFLEDAKPNPHTAHSRADDPPKVQLDLRVTAQKIPIQCTHNESSALRNLLENPIPTPKTSQLKHYKKQIIMNTTGGLPIDLSLCQSNTNLTPPQPPNAETQNDHSSGSQERRILTNLELNQQAEPDAGYSGGHCSYQAYPQHVENKEPAVQSQSSQLVSQSYAGQEPENTYERFTVTSRDPRMYPHNVVESTPIDVQSYPYPSQEYHQYNTATASQNQTSTPGIIYRPDSQQIVSQRFTEKQFVVHQIYSQNNNIRPNLALPYLQPLPSPSHPFFPTSTTHFVPIPQTEEMEDLRYWAQVGKLAHESMTKLRSSRRYYPIVPLSVVNQQVFQGACPNQDMQDSQETPAEGTEEISQGVYYENAARSQSVIQNTLGLENQLITPVHNTTEQHLTPVNENDSDSAPRTFDIPTGTLNDTLNTQNITFGTDSTETPTANQNSENTKNKSTNPGHATELIRELNGLLEDLKLTKNTIIKKLKNKSCFDHSETINKVMKTVHDYCASEAINVSDSTTKVAVVKIQRLNITDDTDLGDNNNDASNDDDDKEDEDYEANTDEDDDSDREPNIKRVRTCSTNIVLPDEYDPEDSRWTLRNRKPGSGSGLVEILPHSGVFVNKNRLANCKKVARNSNELARLLLVEVFSHSALAVCSLTGGRPTSYQVDGQFRPGLNRYAREVLLTYVEQVAEEKEWPKANKNSVMNSMRWKLKKIRDDAQS